MSRAAIWSLADHLGTVPMAADPLMRLRSTAWWAMPRTFACSHGKTADPWFAVYPNPSIWCGPCAMVALDDERRCLVCMEDVADDGGEVVVHESRDSVLLVSRAHLSCLAAASEATR